MDYRTCKACGRSATEVGPLSHLRYCGDCGPRVRNQANDDMHYKRGYYFKHWRKQMAASVGGVLLDDLTANE